MRVEIIRSPFLGRLRDESLSMLIESMEFRANIFQIVREGFVSIIFTDGIDEGVMRTVREI